MFSTNKIIVLFVALNLNMEEIRNVFQLHYLQFGTKLIQHGFIKSLVFQLG